VFGVSVPVWEVMRYQKKIMTVTAIHCRTVNRNVVNPLCMNNEATFQSISHEANELPHDV